jgi:hypothetical protein
MWCRRVVGGSSAAPRMRSVRRIWRSYRLRARISRMQCSTIPYGTRPGQATPAGARCGPPAPGGRPFFAAPSMTDTRGGMTALVAERGFLRPESRPRLLVRRSPHPRRQMWLLDVAPSRQTGAPRRQRDTPGADVPERSRLVSEPPARCNAHDQLGPTSASETEGPRRMAEACTHRIHRDQRGLHRRMNAGASLRASSAHRRGDGARRKASRI